MIFLLLAIAYILFSKGKYSISKYLFFLLAISSISAILVGKQHDWIDDIPFVLYTAPLFFILFNSYRGYSDIRCLEFSGSSDKSLTLYVKVLSAPVIICWFICAFITSISFSLLSSGLADADEYKAGLFIKIVSQYFPVIVVNIITIISSLGYFFLSTHFYYLAKGDLKLSLFSLWLSTIIILQGLLSLSRSSTGTYILVYLGCFILFYPILSKKLRSTYIKIAAIVAVAVGAMMMTITNSKFSDHYSLATGENAILDESKNSSLFSLFDYFGQWQDSSPKIREDFKPGDEFWGLYSICYVRKVYADFNGGNEKLIDMVDKKNTRIYGNNVIFFRDVTTSLIMDFGYIGAFVFILLFSLIVRKLSPKKHILTIKNILLLPVLLPVGVNFYCGNALGNMILGYGIIINSVIYFLVSSRRKGKVNSFKEKNYNIHPSITNVTV